jgi:hypothetical protein
METKMNKKILKLRFSIILMCCVCKTYPTFTLALLAVLMPNRIICKRIDANYSSFQLSIPWVIESTRTEAD